MKWCVYSLRLNSPSFDFLSFLQPALHNGAERVRFITGWGGGIYGNPEQQQRRFDSILDPICRLMGLKTEFVQEASYKDVVYPTPGNQATAHLTCNARDLPRPYPVMPSKEALDKVNDLFKGKRPVVVSMRTCDYHDSRNSGPDWERWAKDHDAVVVPDWNTKPISLDERVAHYELASMNVGVNGGHMSLVYYSYRPYVLFKVLNKTKSTTKTYHEDRGLGKIGSQLPYATKHQRFVWEEGDSYDLIEREFQKVIGG